MTTKRLTDAEHTLSADNGLPLASCQVEYPSASPFNCDNSLILVLEFSYFALYEVATLRRIGPLLHVNASSEPRWDLTDPNRFFYHAGNSLMEYFVATKLSRTVHVFNQYESISAKGESELGEDGESLVLAGSNHLQPLELFVFNIDSLAVSQKLLLPSLDSAFLTPDRRVIVGKDDGIFLYDSDMQLLRQLTKANGHRRCARDQTGKPFLIWDNSNEPPPRSFDQHAIVKIDLETGEQTRLMDLGWEWATHITAPMGDFGWCIVTTYDNGLRGDLWRVWLDGRPAEHLLIHQSDSSSYEGQPRATVSRDGRWLAYNSNVAGRTDVYLVELENMQSVQNYDFSAGTLALTWKRFPNQQSINIDGFPAQPGEAGFVYDGGNDVKLIYNDSVHKWFIPMKLIQ